MKPKPCDLDCKSGTIAEYEKEHGFMGIIKGGLSYFFKSSQQVFPQVLDHMEMSMKNIEDGVIQTEKVVLETFLIKKSPYAIQ